MIGIVLISGSCCSRFLSFLGNTYYFVLCSPYFFLYSIHSTICSRSLINFTSRTFYSILCSTTSSFSNCLTHIQSTLSYFTQQATFFLWCSWCIGLFDITLWQILYTKFFKHFLNFIFNFFYFFFNLTRRYFFSIFIKPFCPQFKSMLTRTMFCLWLFHLRFTLFFFSSYTSRFEFFTMFTILFGTSIKTFVMHLSSFIPDT